MRRRKTDSGEVESIRGIRVLIVEDDEPYRTFLRVLVRRLGCTAATAAHGAEALEKLSAEPFDLLLSDLQMPKLNGLELIKRVRTHPTASGIYAVLITSREDSQFKLEALRLGYDDFLPKSCADVEIKVRIDSARRMLARQRASDAEAARWRMLASRDELTMVGTRRAFAESALAHFASQRPAALVMFDLDDFKRINDTYGHLVGDRILRDVGALFLARTRGEDMVARYGGDEFVMLVPDATVEEAALIARRLEAGLAQLSWLIGVDTLRITVSTGVAHSALLPSPRIEQLIDAADRDLYAKKWLRKHPPATPEPGCELPEKSRELLDPQPREESRQPSRTTRRARLP